MKKNTFVSREDGARARKEKRAELVTTEQETDHAIEFKTRSEEQISLAKKLVVEDEADYITAGNILLKAKEIRAKIDAEKDPILKPAKEIIKRINAKYKPAEDVLDQIEGIVRPKVLTHNNEMEAKAEEELLALQKKIDKGLIKDPNKIEDKLETIHSQVPAKTVHTGAGAIQIRKIKKLVIKDPKLVPDEYWTIDESKLRDAVVKQGLVVPGADWKYENSLAVL